MELCTDYMGTYREFVLTLDNKPGQIAEISRLLADAKINIKAMQGMPADSADKFIYRFIVDKSQETATLLNANNITVTENKVVVLDLQNRPGELARISAKLEAENVNIDHIYSTTEAHIVLGVSNKSQLVKTMDIALQFRTLSIPILSDLIPNSYGRNWKPLITWLFFEVSVSTVPILFEILRQIANEQAVIDLSIIPQRPLLYKISDLYLLPGLQTQMLVMYHD